MSLHSGPLGGRGTGEIWSQSGSDWAAGSSRRFLPQSICLGHLRAQRSGTATQNCGVAARRSCDSVCEIRALCWATLPPGGGWRAACPSSRPGRARPPEPDHRSCQAGRPRPGRATPPLGGGSGDKRGYFGVGCAAPARDGPSALLQRQRVRGATNAPAKPQWRRGEQEFVPAVRRTVVREMLDVPELSQRHAQERNERTMER